VTKGAAKLVLEAIIQATFNDFYRQDHDDFTAARDGLAILMAGLSQIVEPQYATIVRDAVKVRVAEAQAAKRREQGWEL